jgi:hypothetical protein
MRRHEDEIRTAYRNRSPSTHSSSIEKLRFHFAELHEFTWTAKAIAEHLFHSATAKDGLQMLVGSNIYLGIQLAATCIEEVLTETGGHGAPKELFQCWSAFRHLLRTLEVCKSTGFAEPIRVSFLLLFLATVLSQKSFKIADESFTPLDRSKTYSATTYALSDEEKLLVDSLPTRLFVPEISYCEQLGAMCENLKTLTSRIGG